MIQILSLTQCEPAAVVLTRIQFTSGAGIKKRPAVVLSVEDYHNSRADTVVVALTTQLQRSYFGDCDILDWRSAGLPEPSKAKGVIVTIERSIIERRMGRLSSADFARVQDSVRAILGL